MATKAKNKLTARRTFLLDRAKKRPQRFSAMRPEVVSKIGSLRDSMDRAAADSLWISYERDLTEALLRNLSWPARPLGSAVFVHAMDPPALLALESRFKKFAFAPHDGFLPPEELAEALTAENRSELFIGGGVDRAGATMTLWRGDLEPLTVPLSAFEKSGEGVRPDFSRFAVADYGQTIRLGEYEAAADALLYEFDPKYRRRVAKHRRQTERSFGASLRRLRKQRGLRREDFSPDVAAKTIARIEQNQVRQIQKKTLQAVAEHLRVKPEEIETY